jgi:hypothetical protein
MRSHFVTGIFFYGFSFFWNVPNSVQSKFLSENTSSFSSDYNVSEFNVRRLSGERVIISWHTESELHPVRFEVMRKHEKMKPFVSIGIVEPKTTENNSADYSFIDLNNFADSTLYCLKKITDDRVIFYSASKGVPGKSRDR